MNHNRINVLGRTESLTSPAHGCEFILGRVASSDTFAIPKSSDVVWLDGFELIKHSKHLAA